MEHAVYFTIRRAPPVSPRSTPGRLPRKEFRHVPKATIVPILTLALASTAFWESAHAEPRVELELVTAPGFPVTGAHQWMAVLQDLGVGNLRIRQGKSGDRAEIKTTGAGDSAVHRVTGILTNRNQVVLPAGSFSLHEKARIAEWIAKVKAGGQEELTVPRIAFGLTQPEFVQLHDRLAVPLTISTKDQRAADSVKAIVRGLGLPATVDDSARPALDGDWVMPDEYQGMSQGTSLAALLRPLGLAFAPQREPGGRVSLRIAPQDALREFWPAGWPSEKNPRETVPDLFKFLNVEIADTPLPDALGAIQGRLNVPFLYDQNALAREQIDVATVRVSVPAGRTYYKRILDRMLFQAKLKSDVRVDESGKPFLWITSVKS